MSIARKDNKVTIRIYDQTFFDELNDSYEKNSSSYESKNHFIVTLIRIGLQVIAKGDIDEQINCFNDINLSIKELTNISSELSNLFIKTSKISEAHFSVIEKIISSFRSVLISYLKNDEISISDLEDGALEELPSRLEKEIIKVRY